ncbi:MAG: PSD1 and planctomycete cytochrome C domain-containing protein [Limisphaerales bacterium]
MTPPFRFPFTAFHLAAALMACVPAESANLPSSSTAIEFFENRIRPVLAEQCYSCHSGRSEKLKASLRVDGPEHLLLGGDTGPAIQPGDPSASLLIRALAYDDPDLQMPPKTRLPASVVEDFRHWIRTGAAWPASKANAKENGTPVADTNAQDPSPRGFDLAGRRARHWAWQPVRSAAVPQVRDSQWPRSAVDHFLLARLEAAQLRPAPRAGRGTLLRRAHATLTGLPPTPKEVEAYLADPRPEEEAWSAVVDRLLESPHFGEHWARHWLDKVRYAETMGHEFDHTILGAWRYRDYVVRAFNQNLPWDTFALEQIAGDLIPEPRRNPADGTDESRLATAQYWLCQQVHSPVDVRAQQAETVDNQIDVVSKAFLGLTVSCARCHDHKFDAISTKDYYALLGILSSSRHAYRAVDDPAPRLAVAAELRTLRAALPAQIVATLAGNSAVESAPRVAPTPNLGPLALRTGDTRLDDDGWFADGEAFLPDSGAPGLPAVLGPQDIRITQPGWRHSGALGLRFQGSLRTPTFMLDREFLHLRIAGSGSRFSVCVEGFPLLCSPIYGSLRQTVRNPNPHWVTLNVSQWKGRRTWIDFADLSEGDPASGLPAESRKEDGWIAVADVVLSSHREPPPLRPHRNPEEFEVASPEGLLQRWVDQPARLTAAEAAWLDGFLVHSRSNLAASLTASLRDIDAKLAPPVLATTMADGTGVDESVFIRGNHRTPGPIVPRRFLEALSEESPPIQDNSANHGSGRLALAHGITAEDNPLFDRVFVNWAWSHLFGRGLVASVDNFGALGESPSHPELLDWLASEFRGLGRAPKPFLRELLLTEAWRMSSLAADPDASLKDPDNLLFHRANIRRLDAESIRDAVLSVSGRLDPTVGGPPVPIHLTEFMEGRGRPGKSGPLDGNGRRSLYLEVRRNFLSPFMLAFDQPVPATTVGRRSVSNVPAQALSLMNDPLVAAEAERWADAALREIEGTDAKRIRHLILQAFARPPSEAELQIASEYLKDRLANSADEPRAAWAGLCHALLNAKEFIFVD